jgi:hypothetical protein
MKMKAMQEVYIGHQDELSRFYRKHRVWLFGKCFNSVEMVVWFILLTIHGFCAAANDMVDLPALRRHPDSIKSWAESAGLQLSSAWLFNIDHLYHSVVTYFASLHSNAIRKDLKAYRKLMRRRSGTLTFFACSVREMVLGCGFRQESAKIKDHELPPGQNLYGKIIRMLYDNYVRKRLPTPYSLEGLLRGLEGPLRYQLHTILLLSDSMCRQIMSIPGGHIFRHSGGWYDTLANTLFNCPIILNDYRYIIIVCGINVARRYDLRAWHRSWYALFDMLRPVLCGNTQTRVLFHSPIWHPSVRYVVDHGIWIRRMTSEFPTLTFFDWYHPENNPFVTRHRRLNLSLFSKRDRFHLNHKGFRVLWDRMGEVYPELLRLDFKFCSEDELYAGGNEHDYDDDYELRLS